MDRAALNMIGAADTMQSAARTMNFAGETIIQASRNFDGVREDLINLMHRMEEVTSVSARVARITCANLSFQATIEGMLAENQHREHVGNSVAYGEEAFISAKDEWLKALEAANTV